MYDKYVLYQNPFPWIFSCFIGGWRFIIHFRRIHKGFLFYFIKIQYKIRTVFLLMKMSFQYVRKNKKHGFCTVFHSIVYWWSRSSLKIGLCPNLPFLMIFQCFKLPLCSVPIWKIIKKLRQKIKNLFNLYSTHYISKTLLKIWTITSLTAQWAVHIICIFKSCRYVHTYVDINK